MLQFANQIPHAVLLYGEPLTQLAVLQPELKGLLCEQGAEACGACPSCQLFESEAGHPDLMVLHPEGKMALIKIDSVRELIGFLEQSPLRGGMRVVVLVQADALNIAAQNALLKALEEPGAHTLILLLSERPHLLLPTIKSRCQTMGTLQRPVASLNPIAEELVLPFDVLTLAQKWKDLPVSFCLQAEMLIIYDALQLQLQGQASGLHFPDLHAQIARLATKQSTASLLKVYQKIVGQVSLTEKQVALNTELMLCQSLIEWQRAFF